MNIKNLTYLLQQIKIKEYDRFNEFYLYSQTIIKSFANQKYVEVVDKKLFAFEDLIQEVWLNLLLDLTTKELIISGLIDFEYYILDIMNVTLAKIND